MDPVPPIDDVINPVAAYSANQRLSASYVGPLIRVRRDSDSVEMDIGTVANGDIDIQSMRGIVAELQSALYKFKVKETFK